MAVAHAFVKHVKDEFPDATHNCWAFVVGPPGSTSHVGLSDNGEPHNTAGKPMLNTLLHSGVGEIGDLRPVRHFWDTMPEGCWRSTWLDKRPFHGRFDVPNLAPP